MATSFTFVNSQPFLDFAINADTLYPALLAEELRADVTTMQRFQPARIPSFIPDLLIAVGVDLATGSWRLAFWAYGASAFAMLSLVGGHVASRLRGRNFWACALGLAVAMAGLLELGLLDFLATAGDPVPQVFDDGLVVNLQILLMMPAWHSGAFIAGLAVVALAWASGQDASPGRLGGLLVLACLATASNALVILYAVLPAALALADGVALRRIAVRPAAASIAALAGGAVAGHLLGVLSARRALPVPALDAMADNAGSRARRPARPAGDAADAGSLRAGLACIPPRAPRRHAARRGCAHGRPALLLDCRCGRLRDRHPGHPATLCQRRRDELALCRTRGVVAAHSRDRGLWAGAGAMGDVTLHGGDDRRGRADCGLRQRDRFGVAGDHALAASGARLSGPDRSEGVLRAGFASFWHGRTIAASSNWRRQVESTDFGAGRPILWTDDPRSWVQQRHGPVGSPPPFRFIVVWRHDPAALRRMYGPPARIVSCGDTPIWIYPPSWQPLDQLIAMADELVPQALTVGRRVCLPPDHADGREVALPRGVWRIRLHYRLAGGMAGLWRVRGVTQPTWTRDIGIMPGDRVAEIVIDGPARLLLDSFPQRPPGQGLVVKGFAIRSSRPTMGEDRSPCGFEAEPRGG